MNAVAIQLGQQLQLDEQGQMSATEMVLWATAGLVLSFFGLFLYLRWARVRLESVFDDISKISLWAQGLEIAADKSLRNHRWLGRGFRREWGRSFPSVRVPSNVALRKYCVARDVGISELERHFLMWQEGVSPFCAIRNEEFMQRELKDCADFFATVEKTPLTQEQARASICMEDRVQIVAAAGSGKTSVMVAKAGYALHRGLVSPNRILLLAFNKDAAKELNRRITERLSRAGLNTSGVKATTFHKFGSDLIAEVEGKKRFVPGWVENGSQRSQKMASIVGSLSHSNPDFAERWALLKTVFSSDLPEFDDTEPVGFFDADSRASGFQTLRNDVVKSREEQMIADWLYIHGVNYVYESPFEFDVADETHRQYLPDFYYPELGLYHEHFALDAAGRPPAKFEGYEEGVRWKRATHRRFRTKLFETTSAEIRGRSPFSRLEKELTDQGLVLDFQPNRPSLGREPIDDKRLISTMLTFLEHFKSSRVTEETIRERLDLLGAGNRERHRIFANAFWSIHREWQKSLEAERSIDFNDMLIMAADYLGEGRATADYDLVLVDEFQDTSVARLQLVRNLANRAGTQVTVVGDDWQSINRFAGADISVMTEFEKYFGETQRFGLTRTFRCVQQICDVSSRFIMKNPRQLEKGVSGRTNFKHSHISMIWVDETGGRDANQKKRNDAILLAIRLATEDLLPGRGRETLKVLGRYKNEIGSLRRPDLSSLEGSLDVSWGTIHSAKGLEADHIVLVGVDSDDKYGFPSAIEDDPVLNLVMPGLDDYPNSEERRLLYVALTRARKSVTLIGSRRKPSKFLIELLRDFSVPVLGAGGELLRERWCPRCGNTLVVRTNSVNGNQFYGCRGYPSCRHSEGFEADKV
jgi:DNA helicase-4